MKTLFICKGDLRRFYPGIAEALKKKHGHRVFAVTFDGGTTGKLSSLSCFERIYTLSSFLRAHEHSHDTEECIRALEQRIEEIPSFNTVVYADRILRDYSYDRVVRFLHGINLFWDHVLETAAPDAIFGEIASATEWIGCAKARSAGVQYLFAYPTPVAGRFYFIDQPQGSWSTMERKYAELKGRSLKPAEERDASEFLEDFRRRQAKPPYLSSLRSPLSVSPSALWGRAQRIPFRVQTYLNEGPYELGSYHGTHPLASVWADVQRVVRHTYAEQRVLERPLGGESFAYFPLHLQPEFTTDVRAPYSANQVALIENIAKSLPVGMRLYVKEHPAMKGDREISFYQALRKLYNVRLLSPSVDGHELIRNASIVLGITGVTSWEAILYEKPLLVFGKLPYGFYDLANRCEHVEQLPAQLHDVLTRFAPNRDLLLKFISAFLQTALRGTFDDPIRRPDVARDENVSVIAGAMVHEMTKPSSRTVRSESTASP